MWIKILLLFFTFSFLIKTDQSFNQDLGRHLKLGEIILQSKSIPSTNLFSYTNPDFPFINTHWLFEVFIYLASQTIGLPALLILKVIIILLSVWLILKIIPKENQALLLPLGFIFLHVLRERTDLRPEIFSFLFTAMTYFILERFSGNGKAPVIPAKTGIHLIIIPKMVNWIPASAGMTKWFKPIFLLPLIQLIWVNTHIYFFVGLMLQAIFLLSTAFHKLRSHLTSGKLKLAAIILGLSVLASLLNPNAITGVLYPLNVGGNYGYTIVENQTMFLLESIKFRNPNFLFVKISIGIIILSLIFSFVKKRWEISNILISLFGLGLALLNVRSFPYLVFLSFPAVLMNFGEIKQNWFSKFLFFVTCFLLLFECFLYLNGSYYKLKDDYHRAKLSFDENTKAAMDFVLSKNLEGPIYNNFDIGSYIIYRGYPKYHVFVDGRPEAYPAQFFTGVYIPSQSDYKNLKEIEKIYGIKTIIFSHTDQTPWGANFLKEVIKDLSWSLVYADDYMVVLARSEDLDKYNLLKVDLATLNPNLFNFENHVSYIRMAIFLSNTGNLEAAGRLISESLKLFPGSPVANSALGNPTKNYIFW